MGIMVEEDLPFTTFDSVKMQGVLRRIAPGFDWPHRKKITAYTRKEFDRKEAELISELALVKNPISIASDTWTAKDMTHTYLAIRGHWFDQAGAYVKRLLSFKVSGFLHAMSVSTGGPVA